MNLWALATDIAIWILIAGSLGIFGWFLVEVIRLARTRLARERRGSPRDTDPGTDEPPPDD
jgi:phage protein U